MKTLFTITGRRHPEHEKVKQEALTNFHMADEQKSAAPDKNQNDFNSENYQINGDDAENNQNSMNAFQSDLSSDLENLELKNDGRSDESDKPSSNVRPVNSGGPGMKKNKELNVVLNIEIMNLKRKARLEAIERQEREQRKFHSKPAPDFNRIHSAQAKKRAAEPMKVTHPQSPSVLRHHREAQERKQKKVSVYLTKTCAYLNSNKWFCSYFSLERRNRSGTAAKGIYGN